MAEAPHRDLVALGKAEQVDVVSERGERAAEGQHRERRPPHLEERLGREEKDVQ